jgi:hypothetical protein
MVDYFYEIVIIDNSILMLKVLLRKKWKVLNI